MSDTIKSSSRRKYFYGLIIVLTVGWMSFYPIYTAFYKANAIEQYERHKAHMAGQSMFFNPWQYRVLCPLIVEGMYIVMNNSVFAPFDFSFDLQLPGGTTGKNDVTQKLVMSVKNPEFVKYNIVFVLFRLLENIVVFWLAFKYFSLFIKNRNLIVLAIMVLALFMGNSVVDSDYTFNTYMDIIVYLLTAMVIVRNYNVFWIIPITVVGAFNRETSILAPALLFLAKVDWSNWPNLIRLTFSDKRLFWATAISSLCFIVIFVGIRMYYGYEPASTWRVPPGWPMLKLNLFSAASLKTYMELFGVFGFIPVWLLFVFSKISKTLRLFFWILVPVWFGVHLTTAIGFQTRLFLVPIILVFMPAIFEYIECNLLKKPGYAS